MKKFRVKIEVVQTYEFTTETDEFENENDFQDRMHELGIDWQQLDKHADSDVSIEATPVRDDSEVDRKNWEWLFGNP